MILDEAEFAAGEESLQGWRMRRERREVLNTCLPCPTHPTCRQVSCRVETNNGERGGVRREGSGSGWRARDRMAAGRQGSSAHRATEAQLGRICMGLYAMTAAPCKRPSFDMCLVSTSRTALRTLWWRTVSWLRWLGCCNTRPSRLRRRSYSILLGPSRSAHHHLRRQGAGEVRAFLDSAGADGAEGA